MVSEQLRRPTGWIPTPDDELPKNAEWPMRSALVAEPLQARPASKIWAFPDRKLNQGSTGTCVGHAGKGHLMCEPVQRSMAVDPPSAFDLYDLACTLDGFRENDRDVDPGRTFGTTINALMKAMRQLGLVNEWRWASSMDDILDWLAFKGPIVFGVQWFDGFFRPDAEGFISKSGAADSGHAFVVIGYDESHARPHLVCVNSWGNSWGQNGVFRIELSLARELIFERRGDAAAALELDPTPPAPVPEPEEDQPVPTDDVFQYPYQQVLSFADARAAGLLELAGSRYELLYVFELRVDRDGARLERAWTLYDFMAAGHHTDGTLDDPSRIFLVQRVQARHRRDWNI